MQAAVRRFSSTQSTPRVVIAPCHLARSESTAHRAKKQQHHQIANRVAQPSGAATPRSSDAHKRIAAPQALCVLRERTPGQDPKAAKFAVLTPGPGMFVNVRNAPRVVIPPPPRTFRKYCAQSEKTAISPSCKQVTQPGGAATPRSSDAHKRIAVPRLSAFFGSTPDQDPKAAKYAVLIPGPGMFVNVRNAPRVVIAAPSGRPLIRRVSRCVRSFSESRGCTRFHP